MTLHPSTGLDAHSSCSNKIQQGPTLLGFRYIIYVLQDSVIAAVPPGY